MLAKPEHCKYDIRQLAERPREETSTKTQRLLDIVTRRQFVLSAALILGVFAITAGAVLHYSRQMGEIDREIITLQRDLHLLYLIEINLIAVNGEDTGESNQHIQQLRSRLNEGLKMQSQIIGSRERQIINRLDMAVSYQWKAADLAREQSWVLERTQLLNSKMHSLFRQEQGLEDSIVSSIWAGMFVLGMSVVLVLWGIQRRFARCLKHIGEKIQLIEKGGDPSLVPACGEKNEVVPISSALDEMARALDARQVEHSITCHLISEKKRLHDLINVALGMADEVGNPLTAIEGAVDILHTCWQENLSEQDRKRLGQGQIDECFDILRQQTTRIIWVLRQIYNFNVFSVSHHELSDINEIIQATVTLIRLDRRVNDIKFEIDLDKTLPAVDLERAPVALSFLYLIERAADIASETDNWVKLTSGTNDKGEIEIIIRCSPVRMIDCNPDECTVPFRPDGGSAKHPNFELTSVRSMMESHGGRLDVFCKPDVVCGVDMIFPRSGFLEQNKA